ncbi:MAG: extracellular solute-binding protein [Halobacteriaceae archaeon]
MSRPEQRSASRWTRREALTAAGGIGVAGLAGCLGGGSNADSLTVFHAGSLAPPFERLAAQFEDDHGVEVSREAKGSVYSTRKVTEQGRRADVLGVSDYRLLRDMLLPDYGSWYVVFQTNAMTVLYREDAPGADEIGTDNWWEVLSRDGVRVGHSDPAVDPGGYRSVMAMRLGAVPFRGEALYDEATRDAMVANSVVPTGTETKLVGQLESGKLDYAFNYRSVATTADLPSVTLQPQVDLSKMTADYAEHYASVTVETDSGNYRGAPIAYGMAVPDVAQSPDLGAAWVATALGETGRAISEETGFVPLETPVVPASAADAVPERVLEYATAKDSVGPLGL